MHATCKEYTSGSTRGGMEGVEGELVASALGVETCCVTRLWSIEVNTESKTRKFQMSRFHGIGQGEEMFGLGSWGILVLLVLMGWVRGWSLYATWIMCAYWVSRCRETAFVDYEGKVWVFLGGEKPADRVLLLGGSSVGYGDIRLTSRKRKHLSVPAKRSRTSKKDSLTSKLARVSSGSWKKHQAQHVLSSKLAIQFPTAQFFYVERSSSVGSSYDLGSKYSLYAGHHNVQPGHAANLCPQLAIIILPMTSQYAHKLVAIKEKRKEKKKSLRKPKAAATSHAIENNNTSHSQGLDPCASSNPPDPH
eukprot:1155566-Pelagomonas_calceolata.AAC.5